MDVHAYAPPYFDIVQDITSCLIQTNFANLYIERIMFIGLVRIDLLISNCLDNILA